MVHRGLIRVALPPSLRDLQLAAQGTGCTFPDLHNLYNNTFGRGGIAVTGMTIPDNVPTVGDQSRLERSCSQIGIQAQMLIRSMLIRRYRLLCHLSTVKVEAHISVVLYDDSEKLEGRLLHGVFFLTIPVTICELLIISRLYFAFLITPPTHCVPLHFTSKIVLFFAFGVFPWDFEDFKMYLYS